MILVWPRARHICCMEEGFAEWSAASEGHYRRSTGGRDMGVDLVQAAAAGNLQCDLELGFMVMMPESAREMDTFFNVFPRPKLTRAMVALQLRHRYRLGLAARARRLALAMAFHPRLGKASALRVLDTDTLRLCLGYSP